MPQTTDNNSGLDEAITLKLEKLKDPLLDTKELSMHIEQLETLYKIQNSVKETDLKIEEAERTFLLTGLEPEEKKITFSGDAILGALASFGSIFAILHHEKFGVVTSKALGFVPKLRA